MGFFHVSAWRKERVAHLLGTAMQSDGSCVFGTASLLFLLTLREGGCGGEKEMPVLAFLPWKRKIRNGVMGKALLPLLAFHKREDWDWERVGSTMLVGTLLEISSYRFCTPEGILGCYWSPSRPLHALPCRDCSSSCPMPCSLPAAQGSLQLGTTEMLALCIPAHCWTSTSPSFCHQDFLIIEVQETWKFLSQC